MATAIYEIKEDEAFFKEELLDLSQLDPASCTLTLALATYGSGKEATAQYRSLNISQHVAEIFTDMAIHFVKERAGSKTLQVYHYSGDFRPSPDDVEVLNVHGSPLESIVKETPAPRNIDLLDIKHEDVFVDALRFYVFILEVNGERILFFRRYHRNKELKRSKNVFMRLVGTQFVLLDSPAFQFDEKFDAILYHMRLYSFNKANFHHIFRFYELLRDTAKAQLAEIASHIRIANIDEFEKSCLGHLAKLEKLRNIANKPYLSRITMADVIRTIEEFNLKVEVVEKDGEEMLVYDSANQWALLNMLNDDYLYSNMTQHQYEASSKRLWNSPCSSQSADPLEPEKVPKDL